MKSISILVLTVLLSLSLGACSLLGDPVAEKVAGVIDKYCEEPQGARELYRETINEELRTEGHTITVVCNGDTVPEASRIELFDNGHQVAFVATGPPD